MRNLTLPLKTLTILAPVLITASLSLTGCDKTREVFGLKRAQMEEFDVMDREPLSTPTDYKLRPPLPGAPSKTDAVPGEMAKAALSSGNAYTGSKTTSISTTATKSISAAEKNLLAKTGATDANRTIRSELAADAAKEKAAIDANAPGADLVFWKDSNQAPKRGEVIDPIAERQNQNG